MPLIAVTTYLLQSLRKEEQERLNPIPAPKAESGETWKAEAALSGAFY